MRGSSDQNIFVESNALTSRFDPPRSGMKFGNEVSRRGNHDLIIDPPRYGRKFGNQVSRHVQAPILQFCELQDAGKKGLTEIMVCVFYFLWNLVTLKIGENKIGVCRVAVAGIGCKGKWVEHRNREIIRCAELCVTDKNRGVEARLLFAQARRHTYS